MKRIMLSAIILVLILILSGCGAQNNLRNNQISSLEYLADHESIIHAVSVSHLLPYPFIDRVVIYQIRYKSDGYEVIGFVAAPTDYLEREYPVLIYNRGGNRGFGALAPVTVARFTGAVAYEIASYFGYDPDTVASYADAGFIVLASQYRGVAGGTGMEQFGGDDINDVISLIDISESFAFATSGGVYMAGSSRGGMMTYIAARKEDRIRAAAILAGVSDVSASFYERGHDMQQVLIDLIGGTPEELPYEYERRSAVRWANEIDVPLLIIHGGEADWRVPTHHALRMAEQLERYNKEFKLIIYEEADHSLRSTPYFLEMIRWFNKHPIS